MTAEVSAILPIRSFAGMTRLSPALDPADRRALSRALADRAMDAVNGAGLEVVVVSDDSEVRAWARTRGANTATDSGFGLSASVTAVVGELHDAAWMVIHADLPLIDAETLASIAKMVAAGATVVCPSLDGGTNVIAGHGAFEFSYGPGSFPRHLARLPQAKVYVSRAAALEIDTVDHYLALSTLGYTPSLAP